MVNGELFKDCQAEGIPLVQGNHQGRKAAFPILYPPLACPYPSPCPGCKVCGAGTGLAVCL